MADAIDPSAYSSDHKAQIDYWRMVDAILGGEATIKAGGQSYLPKFSAERDGVYNYRLANAPFTNIFADISTSLASKPFAKEVAMKEGTPDQYLKLAENIDGQGNNLHVFVSNRFKAGLDKGTDWILVEFNKAKVKLGTRALSVAEVRDQKLRPYWVPICAEQMIAVYSDFVDGVETIHHARFREISTEINGLEETCVERIRHLWRERLVDETGVTVGFGPAQWKLWEKKTEGISGEVWFVRDQGELSIGVIPLVPVVLTKRRAGSWIVESAIRDLAYAQISAYKQEANLNWVTVMTCFPMFCVSGMDTTRTNAQGDIENIEVAVGPNQVFLIPQNAAGTGPAGTVNVVEANTSSIKELRAQLELAWKKMADLGMQPMTEANLTVVTTANVSKKASSAVQAWAFLFKDAIESAWKLTAQWLGDTTFEPEVIIHTDFAIETEGNTTLDALLKAEAQSIYSKQTVREEFKRRNVVSNDIDDKEEDRRLGSEQSNENPDVGGGAEPLTDPRNGQVIDQNAPPIAA